MDARRRLTKRFRIETALAVLTTALFVLTLITREWIEALTGWDPDHGNGSLEWLIVAALAVVSVALIFQARSDWRKVQALPA
ncbi:MAG TPA: hypothetical protein VH482_13840 [Thermomicrobiales bacterium]|jgi:hypothetical protein